MCVLLNTSSIFLDYFINVTGTNYSLVIISKIMLPIHQISKYSSQCMLCELLSVYLLNLQVFYINMIITRA